MRLGQLARKLEIKSQELISFIEKETSYKIEGEVLNYKIESELEDLILSRFKQASIEATKSIKDEAEELIASPTPIIEEEISEINLIESEEESTIDSNSDLKEVEIELKESLTEKDPIELNIVDGVIKAPEVEIIKPKVIGKIDLPVKKPKIQFVLTKGNTSTDITDEVVEKRNLYKRVESNKSKQQRHKNKRTKPNTKKPVLTELELKEKQLQLAVERRIKEEALKKEKKKAYYKEHVQPNVQPKKATKKQQQNQQKKKNTTVEKEPTTTLGKIWKWFNT